MTRALKNLKTFSLAKGALSAGALSAPSLAYCGCWAVDLG